MKCAIMQPTYIPWTGYFHMIDQVDVFVFLDDVQFAKRSWQQRNKIAYNSVEKMITIPVVSKGLRDQKINEVHIDNQQDWSNQHLQLIKYAYSKKPFYKDLETILPHYEKKHILLSNFTIDVIKDISEKLGIMTTFLKSSDLPIYDKRSKYLLEICHYIGADEYLSAAGSKEYIEEEQVFEESLIKVSYHQSSTYTYQQYREMSFIPYLSIIDYIANRGFDNFREEILK
ncbi:WbqC family protein [Bacillus sp. FJAT-42315]|uniref:WbqC family protein n=1 Tax=Bacillus sp. FJAT-42315 TaxID=2014077 RepID=UPI0012FEEFFB|nr:WbqC family protein [Bacillus sp. FJAT-42315]